MSLERSLYATMVRMRMIEEKIAEIYPDREIRSPTHLYIGQEAVAAGVCSTLGRQDAVAAAACTASASLPSTSTPGIP